MRKADFTLTYAKSFQTAYCEIKNFHVKNSTIIRFACITSEQRECDYTSAIDEFLEDYFQGRDFVNLPWAWKQQFHKDRRRPSSTPHGITSQKTAVYVSLEKYYFASC